MEELSKLKSRTISRIKSFQALYSMDFCNVISFNANDQFFSLIQIQDEQFSLYLINNFLEKKELVDSIISSLLINWTFERIALVDKIILRLAVTELLLKETDKKIIINEYVEIAKAFGTEKSASFVNGLLDKVLTN